MPAPILNEADDAQRAVRRSEALTLRIGGASYRTIASRLQISSRTAYLDVQEALSELDEVTRQQAERYRGMELERLDRMTLGLWAGATSGNTKAVTAMCRVMDRRAKLLGIDAPTVVRHDLSKLSVEELQTLERLMSKLEGEAR